MVLGHRDVDFMRSRIAYSIRDFFWRFSDSLGGVFGGLGSVLRHVLCFFRRPLLRSSNAERNCRADDDCKKNFHGINKSLVLGHLRGSIASAFFLFRLLSDPVQINDFAANDGCLGARL